MADILNGVPAQVTMRTTIVRTGRPYFLAGHMAYTPQIEQFVARRRLRRPLAEQQLKNLSYTKEQLDRIYRKTSGYCHLCHAKLSRKNHGQEGERGAWHVDHSVPRAKGGTDHLNNLKPACISCNLDESAKTSRTARGWKGKKSAPLNPEKRKQAKLENGFAGAIAGGLAGGAIAGPIGVIVGAVTGACVGSSQNPDRQ